MKTLSNDERVNRQKTNEIIESYKHLIMETPNVENVIELKEKKYSDYDATEILSRGIEIIFRSLCKLST